VAASKSNAHSQIIGIGRRRAIAPLSLPRSLTGMAPGEESSGAAHHVKVKRWRLPLARGYCCRSAQASLTIQWPPKGVSRLLVQDAVGLFIGGYTLTEL
jgi:hypothetical protein